MANHADTTSYPKCEYDPDNTGEFPCDSTTTTEAIQVSFEGEHIHVCEEHKTWGEDFARACYEQEVAEMEEEHQPDNTQEGDSMRSHELITDKDDPRVKRLVNKYKKAELVEMAPAPQDHWAKAELAMHIVMSEVNKDSEENSSTENTTHKEGDSNMDTTEEKETTFTCGHCHEGNHTREMVQKCSARKEKGLASRKFALLLLEMAKERGFEITREREIRAFNLTTEEAKAGFEHLKSIRRPQTEIVRDPDTEVNCGYCSYWTEDEDGKRVKVQVSQTRSHVMEHSAKVTAEREQEKAVRKAAIAAAKAEAEVVA